MTWNFQGFNAVVDRSAPTVVAAAPVVAKVHAAPAVYAAQPVLKTHHAAPVYANAAPAYHF